MHLKIDLYELQKQIKLTRDWLAMLQDTHLELTGHLFHPPVDSQKVVPGIDIERRKVETQ